jgi:hypothetical protein
LIDQSSTKIDVYINQNYDFNWELTSYWPFDSNLNDTKGKLNFIGGLSNNFVPDRFGNQRSAFSINKTTNSATGNECFSLPYENMINNQYTLSVWVKIISHQDFSSLLTISREDQSNYLVTFWLSGLVTQPYIQIENVNVYWLMSGFYLTINTWQHLAFSISETESTIYIDGTKVKKETVSSLSWNGIQAIIKLGLCNGWTKGDYYLDDLKIFNASLTSDEIKILFQN